MVIKARILPAGDKEIAAGAIKQTARDITVSVNFDGSNIVGKATVYPDGTADLEINVPMQRKEGDDKEQGVLGLGFVVEKDRWDGEQRIIERLRPVTVGVSPELLAELLKGSSKFSAGGK